MNELINQLMHACTTNATSFEDAHWTFGDGLKVGNTIWPMDA